jgi:micrococcal nuclease
VGLRALGQSILYKRRWYFRQRPKRPVFRIAALSLGIGILALRLFGAGPDNAVADTMIERVNAHFNFCTADNRNDCVIDGDTIRLGGKRIRVEDIDAPETHDPHCDTEYALGERATQRLQELLNAGPFTLVRRGTRDQDIYGRDLRVLERNGQSLGAILVDEGLAREWDGARHPWCA